MSHFFRCKTGALVMVAMLVMSTAASALDAVLISKDGGSKQTVTGTIIKDDLSGIVLEKEGATVPVARMDVVKFKYGNMPKLLADTKEAIDNESWAEAQDFLRGVGGQLKSIDPKQRNLIMQYAFYYRAVVLHKTGDYDEALKAYGQVISAVKDSKFYFEAKLGEAKVLEDAGKSNEAKNRYSLLLRDFIDKAKDLKLAKEQVGPYHLLAKLGEMRMTVKMLNAQKPAPANKKEKLEELDSELSATMRKYPKTEEGAEAANLVKALIWQGQEKWDKLVTFLDKVILEGQLGDKRGKLIDLYRSRADANMAQKDYRAAVLDYMRLWLEYKVEGEAAAEVHYKIAECFMNIKGDNWKNNARRHLSISRATNAEPFATMAANLSKEIMGSEKEKKEK